MALFAGYGLGLVDSFQQQGRAGVETICDTTHIRGGLWDAI